jgi:hypothetical protein
LHSFSVASNSTPGNTPTIFVDITFAASLEIYILRVSLRLINSTSQQLPPQFEHCPLHHFVNPVDLVVVS